MSTNGAPSSHKSSGSSSAFPSTDLVQTQQAFSDAPISSDIDRRTNASSPIYSNGVNGRISLDSDSDPVSQLQRELDRTREEKETLAGQYSNLLAKLTTMRTTLGNKLQQDAEELDRREQQVQQLTAQNDDLSITVETLKQELIASHDETERISNELDTLRSRALEESAQESLVRDRELREAQMELERCRMEREEWERIAMQEGAVVDDLKSGIETLKTDLELEREARDRYSLQVQSEREKSHNLESVLQDFQAAKEHELRQAVKDYDSQLIQTTQALAEFKHRALTAELQLEESQTNISRTRELEKEVKEKNLLIGKLRHEAVIINEHLMEALRRLRRNSSDTNVDRRLVTNVLLAFLTTPRADAKRFEMLSLLATILSWTDLEREKAGLQRAHSSIAPPLSFWSRSPAGNSSAKGQELDKTDETESFSRLWVEFLLTEAAAGESASTSGSPPPRNNTSLPGTPTVDRFPTSPPRNMRRLAYALPSAMASSPSLVLETPPRKGKEKDSAS
ncbi:hypothetical protein L208DRAFT_1358938 [Tricholoma matsutake]|nr:hypothetical protein L208DRAFT_1358938 [Tricholoma matsutake 945]